MWLTDLDDALRAAGVPFTTEPGWQTRGHSPMTAVEGVVVHHTAGGNVRGDLRVVRDGRTGLPGPLAQLMLFPDGTAHIVAAGLCYHAGRTGEAWSKNSRAIGIEAVHDGVSGWTKVQYDAYVRLCAALASWYKLPTSRVRGHKEVAIPRGRKSDPNFDMSVFRARVAAVNLKDKVGTAPAKVQAAATGKLRQTGKLDQPTVEVLQRRLASRYRASGLTGPLTTDGALGKETIAALQRVVQHRVLAAKAATAVWPIDGVLTSRWVVRLQYLLKVPTDGDLGPVTIKALQAALTAGTF